MVWGCLGICFYYYAVSIDTSHKNKVCLKIERVDVAQVIEIVKLIAWLRLNVKVPGSNWSIYGSNWSFYE